MIPIGIAMLSNIVTWILYLKISKTTLVIKRKKSFLYGYWFMGVPVKITSTSKQYEKEIRYHNTLVKVFYISFWSAVISIAIFIFFSFLQMV
jgi:hypothetical protein